MALFDSLGAQGSEVVKLLSEDQAYSKYTAEVRNDPTGAGSQYIIKQDIGDQVIGRVEPI